MTERVLQTRLGKDEQPRTLPWNSANCTHHQRIHHVLDRHAVAHDSLQHVDDLDKLRAQNNVTRAELTTKDTLGWRSRQ